MIDKAIRIIKISIVTIYIMKHLKNFFLFFCIIILFILFIMFTAARNFNERHGYEFLTTDTTNKTMCPCTGYYRCHCDK